MNEDRQIKKIIKQLRKSVKSHDKQADTLEKKLKEEKHGDHEPEMIRSQLSTAGKASERIKKHTRKKENFKAWVQSKITKASDYLDTAADYLDGKEKEMNEEGLRAWFGKSKSKGGKPGWVQVVSGKPCARQPGQKSTPKCVSSAKRASMSDAERKSAQRRKRKADPNQRFKSGAAKPTYVRTDSKRKMKVKEGMHSDWKNEELFLYEVKDKKGKSSGKKDACYHKVKSRYSVWPSAYASGALVKCRKAGAANWGNSTKKEEVEYIDELSKETLGSYVKKSALDIANRGVKLNRTDDDDEKAKKRLKGITKATNKLTKESFQQFQEKCWAGYEKKGMKTMFGKRYPNCVKKTKKEEVEVDTSSAVSEEFYRKKYTSDGYKKTNKMDQSNKRSGDSKAQYRELHKDLVKYNITKKGKSSDLKKGLKSLNTEEMGNISHTKTKKGGKTIIKVNKNDELDAQAAMKNDPKYILGKTRVQADEGYSVNPAQQAAIALAKKEKKEGDMVAKKEKQQKIMSSYDWRSQLESELGRVDECWKTHKKVGMKMKGGKLVPNCVPKNEEYVAEEESAPNNEQQSRKNQEGGLEPLKDILKKIANNPEKKLRKQMKEKDDVNEAKSPAWQRKAGKSESGGLNAKGVASYRAANPGSKLKTAVTTKPSKLKKGSKSANRRKSFCARMKGMKKRLTSAKTARDPDSRINKSLRKWNC